MVRQEYKVVLTNGSEFIHSEPYELLDGLYEKYEEAEQDDLIELWVGLSNAVWVPKRNIYWFGTWNVVDDGYGE